MWHNNMMVEADVSYLTEIFCLYPFKFIELLLDPVCNIVYRYCLSGSSDSMIR